MKRIIAAIIIALLAVTAGSVAQLAGTKTIDPIGTGTENFVSFKQAFDTLNAYGVGTGGVHFVVSGGTYIEPRLVLNPLVNKPAGDRPIVFSVASGASVVLNDTVSANEWAVTIGSDTNAVDFVTLDGSAAGGTDRSWTIAAVGANATYGILVYGDSVQLKNLIVTLDAAWSLAPASQGIVLHQTGASDNCLVENCDVSATQPIIIGTSAGTTQTGNIIRDNLVHGITRGIAAAQSTNLSILNNMVYGHTTIYPNATSYGIYASNTAPTTSGTVVIDGNTVRDFGTNTGTTAAVTITGIYAGSKGVAYTISRNTIFNLFNATSHATTNVQVQGISLSGGDNSTRYNVVNNYIYGMEDNDADASANWTAGIRPNTAGKVYVMYNTVHIKHTTRNHYTAAFICGGGVNASDTNFVRNNIFYCSQTGVSSSYKSYAIYKGGSFLGTLASDYNLLYNDGGGANSYVGSSSATLTIWQGNGNDAHSASKPVTFASLAGNFHLASPSIGDAALTALPVASIPEDFDGDVRDAKYPYMGADESETKLAGVKASLALLDIGPAAVGDSVVGKVYIKPTTKNPITVTAVSSPAAPFSWSLPTPVLVTDSLALDVTFAPPSLGVYSGAVTVTADYGSVGIDLAGTSPEPLLVADPAALAFGEVAVDSAKVLTVSLVDASVNRLDIDSIYTTTPEFLVDRSSASVLGDTVTLLVGFMPTTTGTFADTLYLRNNSGTPLWKIPMSGSSPSAMAEIPDSVLNFGTVAVGDSVERSVVLRNASVNPLTVSAITHQSSAYVVSPAAPLLVAGHDSLSVSVTFKPQAFGTFPDTLTISTSVANFSVVLNGDSPAPILIADASAIDFGDVNRGSTGTKILLLTTRSVNPVVLDSLALSPGAFSVSGFVKPSTLAADDTLELTVTFTPNASGTFVDSLRLFTNSAVPVVTFPLTGTGVAVDQMLLAEDFTNPAGTLLTAAGWTQSGTSTTNPITVASGSLSFGRYSGSGVGNAAPLAATGQDVYKSFWPFKSGSLYLSFMVNVTSAGTGDYFIAFSPSKAQTNYYARLHVKNTTGGYLVGISKSNEVSGGAQYGSTVLPYNTPVLLVVKYTFVPPATSVDTVNDETSVYAFTSTVPETEPGSAEIAAYTVATKSDAPDLGFVTLRQGSSGPAAVLTIDGIRVGTSWTFGVPTGVNEPAAEVPREFALHQNYPNPFNPSTRIEFTVLTSGPTTLKVYNMLGQPVSTLFDGIAEAGQLYQRVFNADRLSTGIYFARLESEKHVSMRKMILVK